jgi:HTH-type transcriptional regulator / antitoxin HigA
MKRVVQAMSSVCAIKPIKTEANYDEALARVEALWNAEPDSPEYDEMDVLVTLIERYEDEHHPIDPPDPIEAILFRMEQQGLTRTDLQPFIGTSGRVSEILNRVRPLTLNMIKSLHKGLKIPLESLVNDENHAA